MHLGSLPNLLDPDEHDGCGLSTGLLVAQRKGDETNCWEEEIRASVTANLSTQTKSYVTGCQEVLHYYPSNL